MNPATTFPSLTSTDGRPVCRFCLDSDESVCRLIKPCKCRGTVALVHPTCLEIWIQTSLKFACQVCQFVYEKESTGLKNIGEWTWPRAIDGLGEGSIKMTLIWIAYIAVLGFCLTMFGFSGMLKWIDVHYLLIYCGYFYIFTGVTWKAAIFVARTWYIQNTIYKVKDLSTDEERKHLDEIQLLPWKCVFCREGTQRCLNCNVIEQEEVGLRKISEWKLPRPKSDALDDKMDFYVSLTCVLYFLRLVYVWMRIGSYEMMFWMDSHAYWMYWGLLVFVSFFFATMMFRVAEQWYGDNTAYRFKDRSTITERRDVTSRKSQMSVISEAVTDDQRTEMKTARSIRR